MNESQLVELILAVLKDFEFSDPAIAARPFDADSVLFGPDGVLDSIALVSFVLDVEEAIRDRSGRSVALADERAMSQTRSPFRRVRSLAHYAAQLLAEPAKS